MKLTDLEGRFVVAAIGDGGLTWKSAASFKAAHGVMFLCPLCFKNNGGEVGTHLVLVWFKDRGAPEEAKPAPRWRVSGTGLEDLTIDPSIHIKTGCCWHGWVRNGDAK